MLNRFILPGRQMYSTFWSIVFLLLCAATATAQNTRNISGVVLDENNEPAIGANIVVKDATSVMAITGLDGTFKLTVPAQAQTMTVSYLGYKPQTIKLQGRNTFKIQLEVDNVALDEVVVIGYGTAKKGNLTGSIASVKSDDIEDQASSNIASSLQGMLAGVDVSANSGAPGEELSIIIRGNASIHADDTPLYVVDGIPVDDLGGLSNNDIASIEILKDASSSAIYGSRGANGVVLITTKNGGDKNKLSVSVAASFGMQQINKKIDVMSAEEWISFRTKLNNIRYVNK